MANIAVDAFPLTWPNGYKRTNNKKDSRFKTAFAVARDQLMRELKLMGVTNNYHSTNVVISTNVALRKDGLPLASQSNPKDPGVAVYFNYRSKPMVFACDTYKSVTDNLYAITKTIEALRGIERWGASDMLERAFTGFAALPAAKGKDWFDVLQVSERALASEIITAYRARCMEHHPDRGGDQNKFLEVQAAYKTAQSKGLVV